MYLNALRFKASGRQLAVSSCVVCEALTDANGPSNFALH